MKPQVLLKSFVNRVASRFGYKIERLVDFGAHRLDVFSLLVDRLNPEDPGFFFVQVGANDGQIDDPICKLVERYHWRGVLVEPLPDVFKRLAENYRGEPQLILENSAIAHEDGMASLWTIADSNGILATFDRSALRARYSDPSRIVEVPVQAISMKTLAQRHTIGRVDLLQVDVEGFDYEIIKMVFHGSLPRPRLIRYEHLHLSRADRRACVDLLASHGYRMYRDDIDTIAYHQAADVVTA